MTTNELRRAPRVPVSAWTTRIIVGQEVGLSAPPAWLAESYEIFRGQVSHAAFPCFFGTRAERRGEMFYTFAKPADFAGIARSVATFCELSARKEYNRVNLALFFEPHAVPLELDAARAFCWNVLQHLHDADVEWNGLEDASPNTARVEVEDSDWEFTAFDTQMFVVGCSPAYVKRKSRNLGPGIVMLFQPRRVFVDLVTKKAISGEARDEVRRRLVAWDELSHHPDLGMYGDPGNREWKQYFLDDENEAATDSCPFIQRWQNSGVFTALPREPATFVELLNERARTTPDARAVTFVGRPDGERKTLSYAELDREARALASQLTERTAPGDRAVLLLPSGLEFLVAFFACAYARLIAVPAYPAAGAKRGSEQHTRLVEMLRDCAPRLLLCASEDDGAALDQLAGEVDRYRVQLGAALPERDFELPVPGDVVFLQYTSGSTALPKGVMVSHANLMANASAITHALCAGPSDVFVSWLPLYHDMGLIGGVLFPLYAGIPLVLMPTLSFLQAPVRWLRVLSEFRGTISGGPDFAYRLLLNRVRDEDLRELDLSAWRVAFCGAEPIRAATMREFGERFASASFSAAALTPCYGLAEATLMVTCAAVGGGARALERDASPVVDCGTAVLAQQLRVCDPVTGLPRAEGEVGEVWVAGPSVALGYWENPSETERVFRTLTLEDGRTERYLRTGDLGFMLEGQLYVSGRLKDLIIVRGQNLYPQDIERVIEAQVAELRGGRVAAFAVPGPDGEGIGVAAELSSSALARLRSDSSAQAAILDQLQRAVSAALHESTSLVLLLKPGTLPRTSSGKLRRSACLPAWKSGELVPAFVQRAAPAPMERAPYVAPRTLTEHALASMWSELLGPRNRSLHADFFVEGGDSVTAARLLARIDSLFGPGLSLHQLFDARTIASQAELLAARGSVPPVVASAIAASPVQSAAPLTAAQRGLWFFHAHAPLSAAYTVSATLDLRGPLDVVRLRRAFEAVLARHAVLRARFRQDEHGEVTWIPCPASEAWAFDEYDADDPAAQLASRELVHAPFDLARGPLVRGLLVRRGSELHTLRLALPHLIADGASAAIFWRELAHGYAGEAPLPELPIQYSDYARWDNSVDHREGVAHWRAVLGDELDPLAAPGRIARTRAELDPDAASRVAVRLPPELMHAVRSLGQRAGATASMTLLAAFDVLLYRYTGERIITIGVPSSTRRRVELENLIGHFVNLVIHRIALRPNASFRAVLAEVRALSIAAAAHSHVPFEAIVAELRAARQASGDIESVHVVFNHQLLEDELEWGDLQIAGREIGNAAAAFDWSLDVRESRAGTQLVLEFRRDFFERGFMQQVLDDYVALLSQITTDPEGTLTDLELTRGRDRSVSYEFESATDCIARDALSRADQQALVCGPESLTFAELARWSQALSERLAEHSLTTEQRVGLCLGRSLAIGPGVLGVLGAGCAFVPLDASYPRVRIAAMIEDAQIRIALVDAAGRLALQGIAGADLILIDVEDRQPRGPAGAWPARVLPEQLAYVIFTSGSSGRPKGVEISQRALSVHLADYRNAYRISADDTAIQFSTISFDSAIEQLLTTLSAGGCVVLRGEHVWDYSELQAVLRDQRVTLADFPTGYWQAWTRELANTQPPSQLRLVTVGGESLPGDAVARWRQSAWGAIRLDNTYGPTEAAITTSAHTIGEADCEAVSVSIGRSYPGRRAYVLDADGGEVPLGGSGELCIGGPSVARGYAIRPAATAERFVPDPFASDDAGARLYRTGDRCRRLTDGSFEYLGRLDVQVKLRGYRIELEEVEAALRALPRVQEAVVVLRGEAERRQLVAYVTGVDDAESLRAPLGAALPAYMVPAAFVALSALPRLPNGKLDRRSLPAPVLARDDNARLDATSAEERSLLAIFRRVLGREDICPSDNFFALGGDSISSLQVVSRARTDGFAITPRAVFEHPTVATLAAFVRTLARPVHVEPVQEPGELTAELRALIASHDIALDSVERVYPATAIQSGLLFHGGFAADEQDGYYVDQLCLKIEGPLDPQAFEQAWRAAVQRHDVLRTLFLASSQGTLQVVQHAPQLEFTQFDARGLEESEYAARIGQLRAAEARGFEVERAPLLRLTLVRRADAAFELIWTNHHAILDGWSTGQLAAEVFADHAALVRGERARSERGPHYEDYVRWLEGRPSSEAYWRKELAGWDEPATLAQAFGAARDPEPGTYHLRQPLEAALVSQLRAAATRARVTLPTLAQAAWAVTLAHYGDRAQAVFGSTFSNRPAELVDSERTVGLFVHSVPLCLRVPPALEIDAFLREVQRHAAEVREHGTLPLADLQRWAASPGRSLFDSVLLFENYPLPEGIGGGELTVTASATRDRTHYPLTLTIYPSLDAIDLEWEWDGAQVDEARVRALSAQYLVFLAQLAEAGDRKLSELTADRCVEPQQLASHPYRAVVSRVAASCLRTPEAVAVHCEGVRTSYAELGDQSDRIASALQRAGVGPESRVGVCVSRSSRLVAALLGVWKAGGGYVPLDPTYPRARLAEMLSGVSVVICDEHTLELGAGRQLVRADAELAPATRQPWPEPHPEQLAYVIYTSGSTGRPKGVAITHGALSRHVDDFLASYELTADDRVLFSSTINFDVSLHELFPALCAGARVVMRGDDAWSLEVLTQMLREQGVTFARIATAYWQAWSKRLQGEAFPRLRQVTVGGEGLAADSLTGWFAGPLARLPLDNLYGPTETTVAALRHRTSERDRGHGHVPIGVPFASRSARVIGAHGQLVATGGLGELCIGGPTLARGYLGMPGLTAERFVPDPERPGARVYRSGDVCRARADGTVEFLGRADAQVKLRGYRIELGEVEAALRGVRGVDAAVAVIKGEGETRRLVGYVTGEIDPSELGLQLGSRLPGFMVPSSFVHLAALPVLPNGKLDRRALPEPELAARELVAPRSALEQLLWGIWRAVLRRDDVSVRDDFFELGGDSILSLQIVARAREAGWKLTPKQVFEFPTIEAAARVARSTAGRQLQNVAMTGDALPLTPIQARFFERHPSGPAHWNQSVLLDVRTPLDCGVLSRVLQKLVERHDALRLRFARDSVTGRWSAQLADPQLAAAQIETVEIDLRAEADVAAALSREGLRVQQSLDLQRGPLLRAAHFVLPDGAARLLLVVHHLAVDGVSWRILLDELATAYAQLEAGESVALPWTSTPWSAWALGLRDAIEQASFEPASAFWGELLRDAVPMPPIVAGDHSYAASRELTWSLSRSETQQLLALAPRSYRMRVDEVLLTALAQAFGGETGELLVNLEGHGREDVLADADLSRTVGWFTTLFPVRLRAAPGAREALIEIKERLRAVPGKGMPWTLLAAQSSLAGEAARALPVPNLSFNYLGVFELGEHGRFRLASEFAGSPVDVHESMGHALDINAIVQDGELSASFRFSPASVDASALERQVSKFDCALRALLEHARTAEPVATASDFPLAALTQAELEASGFDLARIVDLYPATPMQAGLLFHTASAAVGGVYLYQLRLGIEGELDLAAWQAAWQDVVHRYDTLRSAFVWPKRAGRAHTPLQVVQRHVELPFALHDWSNESEAVYGARLEAFCAEDRARGFDPACAPLMRIHMFRRPSGQVDCLWTMHHVLSDGWSSAQILERVLRAYAERRVGSVGLAVPASERYADYVAWLGRQPSSEQFFRERLAAVDEPATVASCVPLTASSATPRGRELLLTRDPEWSARLKQAAQRNRVTLATLAQAAWALVLARRSDRSQVVFGVTVSGRPAELPNAGSIVGPFLNSLPVWVDVGDQRVGEWLAHLQRTAAALRQHEHVPLSDVQRWAGTGNAALFDSLLVVENYPLDRALLGQLAESAGIRLRDVDVVDRSHYLFSLTLTAEPNFELACEWDAERMSEETARALGEGVLSLLELLATSAPGDRCRLSALLEPTTGNVEQVARVQPYRSVLSRIDAWSSVRAGDAAVICGERSVSYAALAVWSNAVSRQLGAARGEQRIGLAVERSVDLIAALLGIWKSGAAYVPLDPAYPEQRLRAIARAAGVTRVITDAGTRARLSSVLPECELIVVEGLTVPDDLDDELDLDDTESTWCEPEPESLAYVLSTSGSTGEPKGVGISHRALAAHVDDYVEAYALTALDRAYQFSTINFDMAGDQIFPPLAVGATLVMRGPELPSWADFHAELASNAVTTLDLPTAFWSAFIASDPTPLPALRLMTIGGEALVPEVLAAFQRSRLAPVRLENTYGPTEATITALVHETTAADSGRPGVPIGRPLPGRTAYVLDRFGHETVTDALGELCIGGPTLARGYDSQAGLTAERFVPDPYSAAGRLYRTGDRCRRLADGTIVFAGRRDDQVKIRGYRIELGDIEAALRTCAGVREAVVVARAGEHSPRLIGYVTGDADAARIESELAHKLPSYLVPQALVALPSLPLKANGKVDRSALPEPRVPTTAALPVLPRGEVETKLLAVFCEVLGHANIGVHDDFLSLGGDSISSLRVVARSHELGLYFTPKQVLDHPTVAELATVAAQVSVSARRESHGALPLTPIQAEFFESHAGGEAHYNQAVLLRAGELLDVGALTRAFEFLVQRHDALRLRFERGANGQVRQRVARVHAPLRVQAFDLRGCADWQAELAAQADALQTSLHLEAGPLLAVGYFRIDDAGEGRLLIAVHHLAVDGVSWRILLDELEHAYSRLERGEEPKLARLSLPWSAWVEAQASYAQSEVVQREAAAWIELLARAPEVGPATVATAAESVERVCSFDQTWTARLLAQTPRAYRLQIDEVLLTALARALAATYGRESWLVDVENHGRESFEPGLDPSRTVGWFTSHAPVLLTAAGDGDVLSTKHAVRRAALRGLHYGLLAPQLRELPRPRVGFNYLGRFELQGEDGSAARFARAHESHGRFVADSSPLAYPLEVSALIRDGELSVRFTHAPAYRAGDALVERFEFELRSLVVSLEVAEPLLSATDFPLAKLDAEAIAGLQLRASEVEDLYAATPLQQGLLFHTLLDRESAVAVGGDAYVNQLCVTLRGQVDAARLRRAFEAVVARHAILRTQFSWAHGGEMVQVVRRHVEVPWTELDASREVDYADWREAMLRADLRRGIDLGTAPLLRVSLSLRPDAAYELVLTNHHALLDGWSASLLLGEVQRAYERDALGAPSGPAFRDYVGWLGLQSSFESFWREKLASAEGATGLLDALGRQPGSELALAARFEQAFSDEASEGLRALARGARVTLGAVFHAAWALVISRYTDSERVVFGTTVSGRPATLPGASDMLGLFINSLPFYVAVPESAPVATLFARVQDQLLELQDHGHTPLYDLQRWAGRAGSPLFDTLLVFENFPFDEAAQRSGALAFEVVAGVDRTHYPLTLTISGKGKLSVVWTWQPEALSQRVVERLAAQLSATLEELTRKPERQVVDLQLTAAYSQRYAEPGPYAFIPVPERVRRRAERTPHALALTCGDRSVSYDALWRAVTGLAAQLGGLRSDARVGVCVERSLELPVALLGVMVAGGAFVPLDPSYPEARLEYMLRDAGIEWVVADRACVERHAGLFAGKRVLLADLNAAGAELPVRLHAEQLAYVLYTSGSTGQPKGVAVRHEALDRFLQAWCSAQQPALLPQLTATDVWLSVTSPSFDISMLEFFAPLIAGARVIVATADEASDPRALGALLGASGATLLQATPTLWRGLLNEGVPFSPALIALAGGEPLPADLAQGLLDRGLRLWNLYGPTESTIWSSAARIEDAGRIVLGAPLPGTRLRVLDRSGRDVPLGGVGELCIAGTNLARGYLGRASATAEQFAPDAAGSRLYRTGDICRLTIDGRLEFVGRRDSQLKLRGRRIELEEIEITLRDAPDVLDAAAIVSGEGERRRLIGFVTGEVNLEEVRAWLASRLPAAMIPSLLVPLPSLPRTLNGKLARARLQDLALLPAQASEPPTTSSERKLARLFCDVLGVAEVSRDTDFFSAGGHSLSAVRLSSRAQQVFGRELPLRAIFASPTLRGLAAAIDASPPGAAPLQLALPRASSGEGAPLSFAQERLWFLWKLEPLSAAYHISGALKLEGELDRPRLNRALQHIVERHENLRTRFIEREGRVEAVVCSDLKVALAEHGDAVPAAIEAAALRPFDLERGPLLRAELFRRSAREHVLLITLHHIVSDGASVDVFCRELSALYAARSLPELTCQFRDFATWERAPQRADELEVQLAYWRARLWGSSEPLDLPADRTRLGLRDPRGSMLARTVPAGSLAAIDALASDLGCTRFAVMLAAFDVLLHRYTGACELRVGIPVSGRRHQEVEPLIGLFVNTLVHGAELSASTRFVDLVRAVASRTRADLEHADVPFARIVAELAPARSVTETPLFNVTFNFEADSAEPLRLDGLRVEPEPLRELALAFDLMLDVTASADTLQLALSYVHDRFDRPTAARLLDDYLGLLGSLSLARELPISAPALSSAPAANPVPRRHAFRAVYSRFLEHAQRQPAAPALKYAGQSYSYAELHAWSSRIEARLRDSGAGAQQRVGVCLDRSPELVAAILGVLGSGAAYVPFDPRYPRERLLQTARDADVCCVISDSAEGWEGFVVVAPDDHGPLASVPCRVSQPDELAYIIYTSGSTGTPKGVAITQRNVERLFSAVESVPELSFGCEDVWTLFHSPSFDFSVWELFGALVTGGTLVVVPYLTTRDPAAFHALLAAEGVSVLSQTPSAFLPLMRVDLEARAPLARLRTLVFGGERLDPSLLEPWSRRGAPLPAIVNMYGITETTVHVTHRALAELRPRSVIGGALDDLTLHVLDEALNEVPINGVGEIYVGGAGVARGYWRRPSLSASRFIPNPFAADGSRLYASGDRARRLADGDVEYLGRSDFQVKIRGFRIELGEIQAALQEHPLVREAIVLVADSGTQLVACLRGPELADAHIPELRRHLESRLPVHMLPAFFQVVSAWPLTPNGKLDQKALLELPRTAVDAQTRAEPATPNEALVCRVFAEVLGVRRISAAADFFELGGHSLIAVRAAAELSAACGTQVEVAALFLHPSVRALAAHLDQLSPAADALNAMSDLLDQFAAEDA